jgi:ABC-type nitrate/sulfonate/bicarbonate transport system substrate-binding protein
MPLWVIAQSRFDQRYGVDVKPIYIAGGATLTRSLVAGDVDIALTGGAVVGAVLSGADLIYTGIGLSTYAFTVYARPEIKEINDFRGKVLELSPKAPPQTTRPLRCLLGTGCDRDKT